MPLDPVIANPAVLKLDDPMEQMGKVLNNAMLLEKIGEGATKRRKSEAYNNAMAKRVKPDGTVDWDGVVYDLGQGGMGEFIPDVLKDRLERDKTRGEIGKIGAETKVKDAEATDKQVDTLNKYRQNYQALLNGVRTIDQLPTRLAQAYKNPLAYAVYGGEAQAKAAYDSDAAEAQAAWNKSPETFAQWVNNKVLGAKDAREQHFQLVEEKGKQTLAAVNKNAPLGVTPKAGVAATYGEKPHAPGAVVNVNGEKAVNAFDKTVGEGRGKKYLELEDAASRAGKMIQDVGQMRGLLSKAFTGKGAGLMTDIVAWGKALGLNVPDDRLVASQMIRRYLKDNIFNSIAAHKATGATLTPMSNLDLKLIDDSNPNQELDPAALGAMFDEIERAARSSIDQYNSFNTKMSNNPSTQPASKAMSMGPVSQPGSPVPIPPNPKPPGAPAVLPANVPPAAVEYLRKNPGTGAAFEKKYKLPPGSAARILGGGGGPTGAAPFPR